MSEVNVMDDAADARVCVMCGTAWPGTKAHRVRALERAVVEAAKASTAHRRAYFVRCRAVDAEARTDAEADVLDGAWKRMQAAGDALDAAVEALGVEEGTRP